ncbi:hypothetical protein Tco_0039519 [Tanacetum coccineum]
MADYQQVLAVHADAARKKKRTLIVSCGVNQQYCFCAETWPYLIGAEKSRFDDFMPFPYPIFSTLKDTPENLV